MKKLSFVSCLFIQHCQTPLTEAHDIRNGLRLAHSAAQVHDATNTETMNDHQNDDEDSVDEDSFRKKRQTHVKDIKQEIQEELKQHQKRQIDTDAAAYYSANWRPVWTRSAPTEYMPERPSTTLYTTLATPVFDSRNYTVSSKITLLANENCF